jgi:hypothetical protein
LLGPQRLKPTLRTALEERGVEGPVAAVTAGWEDREEEVDRLEAHLGRPVVHLGLWRRTEEAFRGDPGLAAAYRERRALLTALGDVFRARMAHAWREVREVAAAGGPEEILGPEREDALDGLRALDERYLGRIEALHAAFEAKVRPAERPSVVRHRGEIRGLLAGCGAIAVAGGNVAVLAHRMRLFGLGELVRDLPIFAWSAGAMACGERIVLFHDQPPQGGPGIAEVFGLGLGLHRGVLPLPHARRRLRLEDPARVSLFARRFAPLDCVALDEGDGLAFDGRRWRRAAEGARRLLPDGSVAEHPPR